MASVLLARKLLVASLEIVTSSLDAKSVCLATTLTLGNANYAHKRWLGANSAATQTFAPSVALISSRS
jgi:hypothetical protein